MTPLPPRVSVRTRLALIYTGLLAAGLIVFGTGVYLVMRDELERAVDTALVANAEHAAGVFLRDVDDAGLLRPEQRLVEQLASTGGRVIVLDASAVVLADSAGAGSAPLPITGDDLANADRHAHAVREIGTPEGERLRLVAEPVLGAGGEHYGYVVWADSTEPLAQLLATVSSALFLGGLLVTGLALLGGLVLARRALAPIAGVTETARAIALSGDFGARVQGGGGATDEVGELAVAFNEMLEALEANHEALQRFLGDASHQLRTPLTSIRANLELLRRSGLSEEEIRETLDDAGAEAERMGRLIADLLSLARADSGARVEFAPVELDALLVDSLRHASQAAGHVRMSLTGVEPAVIEGDRDRLREVLGILLDNAARYTPGGGSVTARLEVRDGWAIVSVTDTGIGLDATDREHLFERLYRGRRAREMRPAGTGLGLAIAHWIVQAHGGSIDLANRPVGGTVATIRLPARSV